VRSHVFIRLELPHSSSTASVRTRQAQLLGGRGAPYSAPPRTRSPLRACGRTRGSPAAPACGAPWPRGAWGSGTAAPTAHPAGPRASRTDKSAERGERELGSAEGAGGSLRAEPGHTLGPLAWLLTCCMSSEGGMASHLLHELRGGARARLRGVHSWRAGGRLVPGSCASCGPRGGHSSC